MAVDLLKRTAKGLVITPDRRIEIQDLEVEGTIVWGKNDNKKGRPCWVTPDDFRQVSKWPYLILSTLSSLPITFPGEPVITKDRAKLSKAMGEQFAKQSSIAESGSGLTGRIVILTAMMIITIVFVLMVAGLLMPSILKSYF